MNKVKWKKKSPVAAVLAVLLLSMAILAGCGKGNANGDPRQGLYFMMDVETESYSFSAEGKTAWVVMGSQFLKDEKIQICAEQRMGDTDLVLDVYLAHEDGSLDALLKDLPRDYRRGDFYLDQDKNLYYLGADELVKFDTEGNVLYRCTGKVTDICQMPDGRLMLFLRGEKGPEMAELNKETGDITEKNVPLEGWGYYLGCDADGPVVLNDHGFQKVDLDTNSLQPLIDFEPLSYELKGKVEDFRMLEEGKAELLEYDRIEKLQVVDISASRKIVIFRDWSIASEIRTCAYNFNHQNEEYYVVLEECDENTDIVDFRDRTGIDITTGKGADIITSDAINDVLGYIQNGALEDLTPYIEDSEFDKENFFPATFGHWAYGGKIYGVDLCINPTAIWIDEELLGGRDVPGDAETLVSAMLNYKGDKKWYWDSSWILHYLLRGSEDLWGIIDKEHGTCDFTGELFTNMMKAAKQHGGDYDRDNASTYWADTGFGFFDSEEKLKSEGRVYVGFLFDDGAHTLANEYGTMAINSSSPNKEGAWAFIRYLLDDDVQQAASGVFGLMGGNSFPASKVAFGRARSYLATEGKSSTITRGDGSSVDKEAMLEPERQEQIHAILEDTRFAPIDNGDILEIILEEADAYFNNIKSLEEVCDIIQNRVKLYLGENQ